MKKKSIVSLLAIVGIGGSMISSCSKATNQTTTTTNSNLIKIALADDIATLDPQMSEDTASHRITNDTFEGLTSYDQSMKIIPGLAESWDIDSTGKIYIFHLRPNLKFSDGSPLTANDVVFTYQRLIDPKVASPYNMLITQIVNASEIIKGTKPLNSLAVKALDNHTVQIELTRPDPSFLAVVSLWNLGIVSKANLEKFANAWTEPKNMVTSGGYKVSERVVKGYILLTKNPYYYDESNVTINTVRMVPIQDINSSLSQYKSGDVEVTYTVPVDQYKNIKTSLGDQLHTVAQEGIYYYDLNMTLPKFKNSLPLRKALSMAVDRNVLVKDILGQGQIPLYSYVTNTVDGGKYAGLDYAWAKLSRSQQITEAQKLFAQAGYGPHHPLELNISYNTNDLHKKVALALGSMWQQVFGTKSVKITTLNQEWKIFLQTRHKADYDVARDAWLADYDSVDSYTNLYQCNNPQNNSHSCIPLYDQLLAQAHASSVESQQVALTRQALQVAMENYSIIPLYQYTYFRLINPKVKNYTPETNHLDHVMSKWYKFN
ncbi:MAG: hypothetical protein RLZZ293_267 [Pseudomonadota bacterium]|jgi:oligopeptide transport system substrate-binding protein